MLHSTILEVMFGLAFIYLELSLVCSAATELLESILRKRAADLEAGILRLVRDEEMRDKLYAHPLIQALMREDGAKPSYIPARTFALALMDVLSLTRTPRLVPENLGGEGPLRKALQPLLDAAEGSAARFQKNLEDWYDASMERVSGWYKRRSQWIIFWLGFVMAVGFNADSLRMANLLARDGTWRASVAAIAEEHVKAAVAQPPSGGQEGDQKGTSLKNLKTELQEVAALGLPFGWEEEMEVTDPRTPPLLSPPKLAEVPGWLGAWLRKVLGLLVTALAVSLGAPFWFDLLNRLSMIRSASRPDNKQRSPSSSDSETGMAAQRKAA